MAWILVSDAGLNGEVSNDEHSVSSDVPADLAHDGDSVDSEREALNLVSTAGCVARLCRSSPVHRHDSRCRTFMRVKRCIEGTVSRVGHWPRALCM